MMYRCIYMYRVYTVTRIIIKRNMCEICVHIYIYIYTYGCWQEEEDEEEEEEGSGVATSESMLF